MIINLSLINLSLITTKTKTKINNQIKSQISNTNIQFKRQVVVKQVMKQK